MKFAFLVPVTAIAFQFSWLAVRAHEAPPLERLAALREFELARRDLRNYWLVEYPRKRRELDAEIELVRKEIEYNKALRREYGAFNRFSTGNPFPITQRNVALCARVAELRLNELMAARNALVRFHAEEIRSLSARVQEARDRIGAIDATAPPPVFVSGPLPVPE